MKKPNVNQGIVQSGGEITAGQIAVGQGAQAVGLTAGATEENRKLLAELQTNVGLLIKTLEAHRADLHSVPEVIETAKALDREVHAKKRNKLTAMAILEGIAKAAGSVSAVGTAVEAVQ